MRVVTEQPANHLCLVGGEERTEEEGKKRREGGKEGGGIRMTNSVLFICNNEPIEAFSTGKGGEGGGKGGVE